MNSRLKTERQRGGALVNLIVLLCVLALIGLAYLVRHPILRFTAESWVVDEPAPHADAIMVLSDDNFYADRATRAAELSRQQVAPVVVASGRYLRPRISIGEIMEHDLIERGVPKEKIVRLDHYAADTIEEAGELAKLAKARQWHSVIVVTSNYHSRRVRYIFGRIFPTQIAVTVASARDAEFDPDHWWEKKKSTELFGHEVLGMVHAMWALRGTDKGAGVAALLWKDIASYPQNMDITSTSPVEKTVLALYIR